VAAAVATAALPDASTAHAGTSAVRAASSTNRPTGALVRGREGFHLSEGAYPPLLSSFSSSPDDEFFRVAGGESPYCSRSRYSSSRCSRHSRRRILFSFLRAARSCTCRCVALAAAWAWGVGWSDRAASTVTLC
jgi:hypothetical protein